jgi:hypothetical protein
MPTVYNRMVECGRKQKSRRAESEDKFPFKFLKGWLAKRDGVVYIKK